MDNNMDFPQLPAGWSNWKIEEKIGEGTYGTVYKASRQIAGQTEFSAIKIVKIPNGEDEVNDILRIMKAEEAAEEYYRDLVNNYIREIQAMVQLQGITNIVTIQDYEVIPTENRLGWTIYIRMELLTSFPDYQITHTIDEAEVIRLGMDICTALDYCEKAEIIHRDLKPDNIFVSKRGEYKLGDFGVARKIDRSLSVRSSHGTYPYMAPEVFKGEKYDHRADIYSLGLVMYRILNHNREPFLPERQIVYYRDREEALNRRISGEAIPDLDHVNPALMKVIRRSLEYARENRYRSAAEMRAALQYIASSGETHAAKAAAVNPPVLKAPELNQTANPETYQKKRGGRGILLAIFVIAAAAVMIFFSRDNLKKILLPENTETDRAVIDEPALKETDESSIPESAGDPALQEETGESVIPESADDPALQKETGESVNPESAGDPALPEETGEPVNPESTGDPALQEETVEQKEEYPDFSYPYQEGMETPYDVYRITGARIVNVRSEPSADSEKAGELKESDYCIKADMGEEAEKWIQITTFDHSATGWVPKSYVVSVKEGGSTAADTPAGAQEDISPDTAANTSEYMGMKITAECSDNKTVLLTFNNDTGTEFSIGGWEMAQEACLTTSNGKYWTSFDSWMGITIEAHSTENIELVFDDAQGEAESVLIHEICSLVDGLPTFGKRGDVSISLS